MAQAGNTPAGTARSGTGTAAVLDRQAAAKVGDPTAQMPGLQGGIWQDAQPYAPDEIESQRKQFEAVHAGGDFSRLDPASQRLARLYVTVWSLLHAQQTGATGGFASKPIGGQAGGT